MIDSGAEYAAMSDTDEPCFTCGEDPEGTEYPKGECPKSQRECGHHCNCLWVNDKCHWCGAEFEEDGENLVIPS